MDNLFKRMTLNGVICLAVCMSGCAASATPEVVLIVTSTPEPADPSFTPSATVATEPTVQLPPVQPTPTVTSVWNDRKWVFDPQDSPLILESGSETLIVLNAATGEKFAISTGTDESDYFWMPDGKGFGYVTDSGKKDLHVIDSGSGTFSNYDLSADVHWNVYGPALAIGNDPLAETFRLVPTSYGYDNTFGVSYDNKWGYLRDGETGNVVVEEIDTGRQVNMYRPDDLYEGIPSWLGGSHFLGILNSTEPWDSANPPSNWVLRIYDADLEQIVATYPWELDWHVSSSPDGLSLVYGDDNICVLKWQTEERNCIDVDRSTSNANFISGFHWSPDGSAISFEYKSDLGGGICIQSLTHGETFCPTMSIPEMAGQLIGNHKWSPDGRFIIFGTMSLASGGDHIKGLEIGIVSIDAASYQYPLDIHADSATVDKSLWRPAMQTP